MASLAALLRKYRVEAGLTQAGLAEKAGLSEQAISLLERGTRRRPRVDTIEALAGALELGADAAEQLLHAAKIQRRPAAETAPPRPEPVRVLPRQLPPTLSDFAGRAAEVADLVKVFRPAEQLPETVQLAAVTGMGGVGKTALAVHVAHLVGDDFPDGQLYLDLRGYGPGTPLDPAEALSQLIRSLGLDDDRTVPLGINELAGLYRSRLAGQRVLIVLDNANGAAQVLPLLPGVPGSAVIATSRRALTTLPGFRQIALAPLSEDDSVELLAKIAGRDRVAAEQDAARSIAQLTGRLPLAVRLIGARLAARPSWPIEHMMTQLHDEHRRLDEFGTGESGVRANIAGTAEFLANSNQKLDRQAAAALPLVGLPDGSDLSALTAAHLLDVSENAAEQILERLVDLNLLSSALPGRYKMHDLIRTFARERAEQTLSEGARGDALGRVVQHYTGVAWRTQQLTHPDSRRLRLASPAARPLPELADTPAALIWLDRERANILGLVQQASESAVLRGYVPELALALFGYAEARSRWTEMRTIGRIGRAIAGDLGYHRLTAWLEHDLGIPDVERGDLTPSIAHFRASLTMFQAIPDLAGQARCCTSLSYTLELMGQPEDALAFAQEALAISLKISDHSVVGISHLALGRLHSRRRDHDLARESFDLSLLLAEKSGNLRSLARRHQIVGQAYLEAGLHAAATDTLLKSFDIFARLEDGNAQAESLLGLATNYLALGDHPAAAERAEAGLQLARAYGNQQREGQLLIELGKIRASTGDVAAAAVAWRQAVTVLHAVFPNDQAAALELLAEHHLKA
ncbi:helix-turn-helix domain-containing protein [Streptomyces sp. SID13031]|uniref:ATP-binding protein n=1 Tax=Streptomyces sp. SID13031 TaxID=2706046 RepID=UPI0013CBA137|nr:helix-turn-helix domain-containing protein [Streptomyces sp. SID13031]NEA33826.1 helix-turn-helix domain-containing protein [Streptomyces sp. SID13031]